MENNIIGFWKPNKPYGEFSQWYKSEFEDSADIKYICAEQYMMAQKALIFNDTHTYNMIMKETNPSNMKKYGRMISNFNSHIWDEVKENIVYMGNMFKFSQNPELKAKLLATGNATLCEASPYDNIWGIGSEDVNDWHGENLLGKILMQVREFLK